MVLRIQSFRERERESERERERERERARERESLLWPRCDCLCPVSLPNGTVGWSAVCICGISWSCSLTFIILFLPKHARYLNIFDA